MRFYELTSGLRMPASNEEEQLIEKAIKTDYIFNSKLSPREQSVAKSLVSRGLMKRKFIDNKMVFCFNGFN